MDFSTSLGSLQKFEGAAGEFKGAHGSRHPLISSPVKPYIPLLRISVETQWPKSTINISGRVSIETSGPISHLKLNQRMSNMQKMPLTI